VQLITVFESVSGRESTSIQSENLSEIVANKLGTIVSVADFRNSMTREIGFGAVDHSIRECVWERIYFYPV